MKVKDVIYAPEKPCMFATMYDGELKVEAQINGTAEDLTKLLIKLMSENNDLKALILTAAETYEVVERCAKLSSTEAEFEEKMELEYEAQQMIINLKNNNSHG
jgi:regulator of sirC expression with transglutaminase-like and TPR domain